MAEGKARAHAPAREHKPSAAAPRNDHGPWEPGTLDVCDALGNQGMLRLLRSGLLSAKRQVSVPGDPWEQEADRVADLIVSPAPASMVQRACTCGTGTPCEECEKTAVLRKSNGENHPSSPRVDDAVARVSGTAGDPLGVPARQFFEGAFGQDLSDVRIHTGITAASSARSIGADAYTVGSNIVFDEGRYAPDTPAGRKLLAHELTHVLQQRSRRDDANAIVQRQPKGAEEGKGQPLVVPFEVEYVAYEPYEEEERPSIYPAMSTAVPQALGFWTHPPGSALSDYFLPAWARKRAFLEPLGRQPGGNWLLERYAGTTAYDPQSPRTSSRVKEVFGFGLRKEMYPRSFLRAEQGSSFATYTKMTPEQIKSIPDILRRVNSGGKLSYTAAELELLHRAAAAHGDYGQTRGSPFLSTTARPELSTAFEPTKKKFLSGRPYVIRIRVPHSMVFEMNKMPTRTPTLVPEQEMLVTTDMRNRIVAVQPNPTSSLARAEPYMRWGGRAFLVFGLGVSAYRIASATDEERDIVIMQELASHGGGLAGAGIGASGCVVLGIATGGVVLVACGLVGAFLGGEAASTLIMMPFNYAHVLTNVLPHMAMQLGEGFEAVGNVAGVLPAMMAGAPPRMHALMHPGNWDMRYFPPAIAPDVAAVGIAMWERLGPLGVDEFMSEMGKPVGSFGVPVASAKRIAALLSGPDKQYNANMPGLYASLGTSLPPAPVEPGINILEMRPYELIELLATRRLTFLQDPRYLGGWASRLETEPMYELRLRHMIEQRERIAEDNWQFPGKTHEQVRALRRIGQDVWNALKGMDDRDFGKNVNRTLSTFGISDWAFKDAARALNELSMFGRPIAELTESERVQHDEVLAEFGRQMGEMTPEDYAFRLVETAGLVYIKDPTAESYAAINRVKQGFQPW